jgi:hypothetical protein
MVLETVKIRNRIFQVRFAEDVGFAVVEVKDGARKSVGLGFLQKRGKEWVDQTGRVATDPDVIAAIEEVRKCIM